MSTKRFKNMLLVRKLSITKNCNIRDLTQPMPPEGFCPICEKKDDDCKCEKYNCKCNVLSLECNWPLCICQNCLEIHCKCEK